MCYDDDDDTIIEGLVINPDEDDEFDREFFEEN